MSYLSKEELTKLHHYFSPEGILSIYLNLSSRGYQKGRRWKTELNSGLRDLQKKYPKDKALAKIIEKAKKDLSLFPLSELKRSIVSFISNNPELNWRKTFQLPLKSKFIWQKRAYLRPLVAMLDKNPIVGIGLLTTDKVRFLTWRQGLINEELVEEISLNLREWRRYVGPAPSISTMSQQSSTQTDLFDHRMAEQIDKFLRELATKLPELAKKHNWERLVFIGDTTLVESIKKTLDISWQEKIIGTLDQILIKKPILFIAEAVTELISQWKQKIEEKEVDILINETLSGGRACLGPQDCLNLLKEQRVAHLYFCSDIELSGFLRPDGYYVLSQPEGESNWQKEPYLIEKMIELALNNGVRVTPVEGEPAHKLAEQGGVGAFLHY
ncbi:MAG: VLRF1 family aeRF1-type release factor [Candidatus Aminicenantia bacterium]